MKIVELKPVSKNKVGRIIKNGVKLEPHEYETIFLLANLGYNIELVRPSNIPHSNNPDLEMQGTFWEMKGPESPDEDTIATKFRKAVKQSGGRAVYDIRRIPSGSMQRIEQYILKLFKNTRGMRRIILIQSDDRVLDITK